MGKITNIGLLRIALVLAIVYLASNDKDGWGWLILILLISLAVKKVENLNLNFYTVRSQDGKWLRAKRHGYNSFDSNGSWTEDLAEAKIYSKPGPAKTQVTF